MYTVLCNYVAGKYWQTGLSPRELIGEYLANEELTSWQEGTQSIAIGEWQSIRQFTNTFPGT